MSQNPKVAIVTPIHDGLEHTLPYLDSIAKGSYDNIETIIVDDGSTDGSKAEILKRYPKTIVLDGDGNLWWSGATNKGVERAIADGADYVYTVNNDVELHPDVITNLVKCAKDNPRTLVGCKIYYIDNRKEVWYFGCQLDNKLADIYINNGRDEDFTERVESGALTGMGVLIPVRAFADAGLYDADNFPQYFGDSDFSLRAKAKGYKLMVDPDSKLYSDVASSWVQKQMQHPTPGFIWQLFFHMRSPYSFQIRYRFYKRHWGRNYLWILTKFYYRLIFKSLLYGLLGSKAKKVLRRLQAKK